MREILSASSSFSHADWSATDNVAHAKTAGSNVTHETNTIASKLTSSGPAMAISMVFSGALLLAVATVLRPFALPLLWASVLTITTWPLFARLRRNTPNRPWVTALLLTLSLGMILLIVAIPLPLRLADEALELGKRISAMDIEQSADWVRSIPLVGELVAHQVSDTQGKENVVASFLSAHQATLLTYATQAARGIVDTIAVIVMSLVGCFFLYLHGETLVSQSVTIITKLGARRAREIFEYITSTIRGAAYSVIATAIAQGTLGGIGYAVAGAPLPFLLALTTMIFSLVPFGAPLLYVPVATYLIFFSGLPWFYGAGLLLWGVACISTIDNLLRSLLISQTTRVSPIIVFVGVVGGVLSFGLLGVFVGPALIGVAQTIWLDFAEESVEDSRASHP